MIVFVLIFWFWWFNGINPTVSGAPISIVKIDAMEAQIKMKSVDRAINALKEEEPDLVFTFEAGSDQSLK